jgi:hypothetical protein
LAAGHELIERLQRIIDSHAIGEPVNHFIYHEILLLYQARLVEFKFETVWFSSGFLTHSLVPLNEQTHTRNYPYQTFQISKKCFLAQNLTLLLILF